MKLFYILNHPIQYQTPLIQYLVKKKIDITVGYKSLHTTGKFYDKNFQKKISWNQNLIKDYKFIRIKKYNFSYLFNNKTKYIWLHGTKNFYNFLVLILANMVNKKVLIREENTKFSKNRNNLNIFLNNIYYKLIDKFVDHYLSIGKLNRKYYLSKKINSKKIINVPYVVNNSFFIAPLNKLKKKINFLFVGKITSIKGIETLCEAIIKTKSYKNISFNIVGTGPLLQPFKNKIKKERIKFVKFHGFVSQEDLKKIYKKTDVLIVPSKIEPWGLVVNEAMCSGNAIIASELVGCAPDLIKVGHNGYLFKTNDSEDLIKKIIFYLNNRNVLQTHKKNSQKIISKFSFEKCFKSLNKIIK